MFAVKLTEDQGLCMGLAELVGEIEELKGIESANHSKRISAFSRILAREMGMREGDIELIAIASCMHDVGKVGVADSILSKTGALTQEEYREMKRHTEIGYDILSKKEGEVFKAAAAIAYEHHERHNGGGYPRGIAGEEIHPFARIVAMADVFDALISNRVYKCAWDIKRVKKLVEAESGLQFHPQVAAAFLRSMDELMEVKERFAE